MTIQKILNARELTHGDYGEVALFCDQVLRVVTAKPGWHRLNCKQKKSMLEIVSKMARILCGDPDFDDHWADIVGYAELARPCR